MLEVFVFLGAIAASLAIGHRAGRRKEPQIVGNLNVPMIEAGGQRVVLGRHDMTVSNIMIKLANEQGPRLATIELIDSAEWESKRRAS